MAKKKRKQRKAERDQAFRERQRKRAEDTRIETEDLCPDEFESTGSLDGVEIEQVPHHGTRRPNPDEEVVVFEDAPSEPPPEGDLVVSLGDADPIDVLTHMLRGGARKKD